MGAHFEQTCDCGHGIIRVYDGWRSYESRHPFRFALFVIREDMVAYFKGLRSQPEFTRQQWRAINDCLARNGFTSGRWEEYKDDRVITRFLPVLNRKEFLMSVEKALAHADKALASAVQAATDAGETDLAAALSDLQSAHAAASSVALNPPDDYVQVAQALLPGLAALQQVKSVGLAHPDQSAAVHSHAKAAVAAVGKVAIAVIEREIALVE